MSNAWSTEEDARFRAAVDGEHVDAENNGRPSDEVSYRFDPLADFAARTYPDAEPLLGERGAIYLATGSLLLVYGGDGTGKSTWTIDGAAHLGAGRDWLGLPVPRPARCLLIENEGPAGLFQAKLEAKRESWDGPDFTDGVHVYAAPWSAFTFADEGARAALTDYCDEQGIDVVMANPTLGLGVAASGRPDETGQFVEWLKECGLGSTRAFWLLHHENKSGQISGDWGRHPDTKVQLQADGNRQRTRLTWEKTRWATLESSERAVMLEWELETQGYTVTPLDTVGASDELLVERLSDYLEEHPATVTKHVLESIAGTDSRLAKLLKERPEFDCCDGPRGAKLWTVAATSAEGAAQ
jgi:AAA domain